MIQKINWLVFVLLVLVFCVAFLKKDSFRDVSEFEPETLKNPIKTVSEKSKAMSFVLKDDLSVSLVPLYNYEVSGLVVRKTDNDLNKSIIMLWGKNLEDGTFQYIDTEEKKIIFHPEKSAYTTDDTSRYTLYFDSDEVRGQFKEMKTGDQIKVKGQILGKSASDQTADTGFCKALYVQNIEILKSGDSLPRFLFTFSLIGLALFVVFNILWFFIKSKEAVNNKA